MQQHHYQEEISSGLQTITTGISAAAFRTDEEILICLGNSGDSPVIGPLLAHHALNSGCTYRVQSLNSHEEHWSSVRLMRGADLMRIAVPQGQGYAIYRFQEKTRWAF